MAVAVGTRSGLAERGLLFYLAADGGYAWLAVLAVASLFYYLRWLAPLFEPAPGPLLAEGPHGRPAAYATFLHG